MTGWRFASARSVGTSHTSTNTECQDAYRAAILEHAGDRLLLACVADGAGSAANSAAGSAAVCEIFIDLCQDYFGSGASISALHEVSLRDHWLENLRQALVEKAAEEGLLLRDLATTFLGAIMGDRCAVFMQIGDGAILIQDATSTPEYTPIFWPQHGQYVNTTNFITDLDAVSTAQITIAYSQIHRFVMFTDGLERLLLDFTNHCAATRTVDQLMSPLLLEDNGDLSPALAAWLDSPAVNSRTDDDKTLILGVRLDSQSTG